MIPRFNASMVLPPFLGESPTTAATMSPFHASMLEFTQQFATSPERAAILNGLLAYREALRNIGIANAFQWMDGSFVEDVETSRGRAPADIDVVTFGHAPQFADPAAAHGWMTANDGVLNPRQTKQNYSCDAYFVDMEKLQQRPHVLVERTRYWFGLFSHQRETALWKGMVQVPLSSDDDQAAELLQNLVFEALGGENA
ncbi:DUF6932 family protein [Burkholderia pyrrocinia]|uniref:DUF6932 family protein n=1 Tax=Burkholderia pyrrocinia TaxID=60550 RepID=UPI001044E93F|nr:hypothetical protein [Burkholderia pyrrocinia]TDA45929.1 hypothetical protein EVG18_18790 [Burkholderia pyrrocinia]